MKTSLKKLSLVFSLSLIFFLGLSISTANAQMGMHLLEDENILVISEMPAEDFSSIGLKQDGDGKRMQSFFVELGGPGLIFTINYDTRFTNSNKGVGMRVGLGGFYVDGDGFMTIPIQVNYLLGEGKHFFEIGAGATIFTGTTGLFDEGISNTVVYGTMTFGYRLQPEESGFSFRAGINPIFGNFDSGFTFIPWFPGISFGYSW